MVVNYTKDSGIKSLLIQIYFEYIVLFQIDIEREKKAHEKTDISFIIFYIAACVC